MLGRDNPLYVQGLLGAWALVFLSLAAAAQDAAAQLDEVVQTYVQNKTFMGSVLVARDREDRAQQGLRVGESRMEHPEHADDEVPARIDHQAVHGRVDPAARGARQAEGRRSGQEAPARCAAAWDGITIFNLLTHTSGIPNFTSLPEYRRCSSRDTPSRRRLRTFRDKPLDFVPGREDELQQLRLSRARLRDRGVTGGSYEQFVGTTSSRRSE